MRRYPLKPFGKPTTRLTCNPPYPTTAIWAGLGFGAQTTQPSLLSMLVYMTIQEVR